MGFFLGELFMVLTQLRNETLVFGRPTKCSLGLSLGSPLHVIWAPARHSQSRDYNYFLLCSIVIFKIESLLQYDILNMTNQAFAPGSSSSSARGYLLDDPSRVSTLIGGCLPPPTPTLWLLSCVAAGMSVETSLN